MSSRPSWPRTRIGRPRGGRPIFLSDHGQVSGRHGVPSSQDSTKRKCGGVATHTAYHRENAAGARAGQWDATVTKMIKAFGAPIDETDAKTIAEYLKKNYGS